MPAPGSDSSTAVATRSGVHLAQLQRLKVAVLAGRRDAEQREPGRDVARRDVVAASASAAALEAGRWPESRCRRAPARRSNGGASTGAGRGCEVPEPAPAPRPGTRRDEEGTASCGHPALKRPHPCEQQRPTTRGTRGARGPALRWMTSRVAFGARSGCAGHKSRGGDHGPNTGAPVSVHPTRSSVASPAPWHVACSSCARQLTQRTRQ